MKRVFETAENEVVRNFIFWCSCIVQSWSVAVILQARSCSRQLFETRIGIGIANSVNNPESNNRLFDVIFI